MMGSISRLFEKGYQLMEKSPDDYIFQGWAFLCITTVRSQFRYDSAEARDVLMSRQHFGSLISTMESLSEKLQVQSLPKNTQSAPIQYTIQIDLNIEHLDGLTELQRTEAEEILGRITREVRKKNTNWEKVRGLLNRSFDVENRIRYSHAG